MKMKLESFDDQGKIIKEEICKSEAEAISKIGTKKYYRVHKCFHDEVPYKPCVSIREKKPVIVNEISN